MSIKRLQWSDLRPDEIDGVYYGRILHTKDDNPMLVNNLKAVFQRFGMIDTRNTFGHLSEYRFFSNKYFQCNEFTIGYSLPADDDEWIVESPSRPRFIGLFKPPTFEAERELERRLFIELVSVPAGRFKGLLLEGGVEYQRQLERFGELTEPVVV